ncbi:hypothetical protein H4R18_001452 [Coemansia javaensis]|uniref:Tubulin-specific chaperone D n=1 Tax=Coemansia javaensis TaxID=2761396 RepID=A0A9W8HLI0_9FUNG|nr:hypothetical protein H4R18_001452 [Coemansia javaensis]
MSSDEVGSVPTFFREHAEFFASLDTVAESAGDAASWTQPGAPGAERELIRGMCATLDAYQEQPTCLDPHLERMVGRLMGVVQAYVYALHDGLGKASSVSMTRQDAVFDVLYTLCKVRGYKVVVRLFPHGVDDVEPALTTLWRYSADLGASSWKARYVLLIWLSLLAMIPFDIESIDSGLARLLPPIDAPGLAAPGDGSLVDLWVALGKLYLARPGCDMDGAAAMLARLLTRKDTAGSLQPAFVRWAVGEVSEAAAGGLGVAGVHRANGALRVLCHLFAAMDSAAGLGEQAAQLQGIFQSGVFDQHSITRKLVSKAAQRLALLMLPPAAQGSGRLHARPSVRANLAAASSGSVLPGATEPVVAPPQPAPDAEIPEGVEALVGTLLGMLHDKDTIVRWSAAKGVGRVAERLPPVLAREIASAVVAILRDETLVDAAGAIDVSMTAEASWHGALLCLAELSRRGLLCPDGLREAIPWVVRGLTYEIQRGDYSVGSNVRDAACYVMWSLARIPNLASRRVFAESCLDMATALVSVAVFDRESSVRRAASAAFQEHVGRQSGFPHGISVLQLADFFSVGIMRNAFVVAGRRIAEFDEYRRPLLRRLCSVTIYHWDPKTRALAARALHKLVPLDAGYVCGTLLPDIVASVSSPFLAVRHGAITAVGAIAEAAAGHLAGDKNASEMVLSVAGRVPARYTEDFGAGLTLEALAQYVGGVARGGWAGSGGDKEEEGEEARQQRYFGIFAEALVACKDAEAVVEGFTAFVDAHGVTPEQHERIVEGTRTARSGTSREGFVLALGALSAPSDLDLLCALVPGGATVEIRRNAAVALGRFCARARRGGAAAAASGQRNNAEGLAPAHELAAVGALARGLADYSTDNRGDVGSWVRRQCLVALAGVLEGDALVLARVAAADSDLAMRVLGLVLRAATEKIDQLRAAAGRVLAAALGGQRMAGADPHVAACVERLAECGLATAPDSDSGAGWADPAAAYARVVPALAVDDERLRQPLFEGLVVAGAAEPLGRFAVDAVAAHAEALPDPGATAADPGAWSASGIVAELTRLLLTDRVSSRAINPALVVADRLAEQGALHAASADSWTAMYGAVRRVAFKLRAPQRLLLCLKLYGSLALASRAVVRPAAESLLAHMGHPDAKIRQAAADHLFAAVCIHGAVDAGDDAGDIEQLLAETEWARDNAEARAARARLAALVRARLPGARQ